MEAGVRVERARRDPVLVAALAAVAAAAWIALVVEWRDMTMEPALFLAGWVVMMTAMMLPSIAPLALVQRRSGRGTVGLSLGYLLVWAAVGLVAYAAVRIVDPEMASNEFAGAVLAAAGLYQLTPLKDFCLRKCRDPVGFMVQHWRGGRTGALRLGVAHGVYCVGCCVGLMAVLVLAAAMSLVWAVAIAAVVFAEKAFPGGDTVSRIAALGLIVLALVVANG